MASIMRKRSQPPGWNVFLFAAWVLWFGLYWVLRPTLVGFLVSVAVLQGVFIAVRWWFKRRGWFR